MEETEPATAQMLLRNGTRAALIESNNGGRGFARNVQRKATAVHVEWFHQSGNKESRILTNSATVLQNIRFPEGWRLRWPELYAHLTTYKTIIQSKQERRCTGRTDRDRRKRRSSIKTTGFYTWDRIVKLTIMARPKKDQNAAAVADYQGTERHPHAVSNPARPAQRGGKHRRGRS